MTYITSNHKAMQVCIPRDRPSASCHSSRTRACAERPVGAGRPRTGNRPAASSHTPNHSRSPQTLGSPLFLPPRNTSPLSAPPRSPRPAPPGPQPGAVRQAVLTPPPPGTHGLLSPPGPPGPRGPSGPGARPYAVVPERGGLQGDELGAGVQEVEWGPPTAAVAGGHAGRAGGAAPQNHHGEGDTEPRWPGRARRPDPSAALPPAPLPPSRRSGLRGGRTGGALQLAAPRAFGAQNSERCARRRGAGLLGGSASPRPA